MGDAITKRNLAVEKKHDIVIKHEKTPDIVSKVRSSTMSGTIEFDAILASGADISTMATEGLLYDLNTVDRFDFTKSYWDSNACEQLSMGGKLYFTNCALNIHALGWAMFFNKYLIEEYNLESPYALMEKNEWTIDNWAELVKSCNADLNGDGSMTVEDRYGLLAGHAIGRMFSYAAGLRATVNDPNTGKPVVTLMSDKNKISAIYSKLNEVMSNSEYVCCSECDHKDKHEFNTKFAYARHLFTQDYYLFTINDAEDVHDYAQMEHEFGIVPIPKYDSNQESYMTQYPANNNTFALPSLMEDKERTFNIIEDFNYYSSFIVYKAWFDVILTRRYARDDASEETLRTLKENRVYDIGMFYDFGGLRTRIMDTDLVTSSNIVKNYDRFKNAVKEEIDNAYDRFLKENQ